MSKLPYTHKSEGKNFSKAKGYKEKEPRDKAPRGRSKSKIKFLKTEHHYCHKKGLSMVLSVFLYLLDVVSVK